MPDLRTEISEIVTGLGMLGLGDVGWALARPEPPPQLANVGEPVWRRLADAHAAGSHADTFAQAWNNGVAFLRAGDGLRGRLPERVEWKGPDRPPEVDPVPADLRIDHVWLVSCKYLSKILHNGSPLGLFGGGGDGAGADWYAQVSPAAYQALYDAVVDSLESPVPGLPGRVVDLERHHRDALKPMLSERSWPERAVDAHRAFVADVSRMSAERWRRSLGSVRDRERLLWRLLRLGSAPYFVLGTARSGEALRLRVLTPWDWRQAFRFDDFDVWPDAAGQPQVRWRATFTRRDTGAAGQVDGHVEIRWSHGRFQGAPEAKVYLDTPHAQVAGYEPLA